jgi:hypothetical protein
MKQITDSWLTCCNAASSQEYCVWGSSANLPQDSPDSRYGFSADPNVHNSPVPLDLAQYHLLASLLGNRCGPLRRSGS